MELFLTAEIWNLNFYAFNVELVFVFFLLQVVKGTGFRFSATEVLLLQFACSTCTFSDHPSTNTLGKISTHEHGGRLLVKRVKSTFK